MPEKKINSIKDLPQDSRVIKIDPQGKYLVVMPIDADIKHIAPAISEFFKPTPVFVLAAQDVNQVKIAELLGENK